MFKMSASSIDTGWQMMPALIHGMIHIKGYQQRNIQIPDVISKMLLIL